MSQLFTLSDIIDAVDNELDLIGQDGVADSLATRAEKVSHVNNAVSVIEKEVHKLGLEDEYFLATQPLMLDNGQQHYSLPTNIYANKIKKIIYAYGTTIYEIRRLRRQAGRSVPEQIAFIEQYGADNNWYQYLIKNDSIDFRPEIVLYPASRETVPEDAPYVTIWYTRKANVLVEDDDMLDVPESFEYIQQFLKCRLMSKRFQGVVPEQEVALLESYRKDLIDVLTEMVPDEANEVEQDLSFYQSYDCDIYGGVGGY